MGKSGTNQEKCYTRLSLAEGKRSLSPWNKAGPCVLSPNPWEKPLLRQPGDKAKQPAGEQG
jgi:hypothetical protein